MVANRGLPVWHSEVTGTLNNSQAAIQFRDRESEAKRLSGSAWVQRILPVLLCHSHSSPLSMSLQISESPENAAWHPRGDPGLHSIRVCILPERLHLQV